MAEGKVTFFDEQRGFGFIEPEEKGPDLFFHFSDIVMDGFKTIHQDARVLFNVIQTERGERAATIQEI